MFVRALFICMVLLFSQSTMAITITLNGRNVNLDDIQNANIDPSSISDDEFNRLTPAQQQQVVDEYNRRNNTTLSTSQFTSEVRDQANNTDSNTVQNQVNEQINQNPSVRDAINDPANADTAELQQNANLTNAQIAEIEQAQAQLRQQQEATAAAAAELARQQAQIQETQNSLNSLNENASSLETQATTLQNQISNTSGQIADLERQAAEAQAAGDVAAAQEHEDSLARLRAQEQQTRQQLAQANADKQRVQNDIQAANTRLNEQQRQQQIQEAALASSRSQEEALTQSIVQNVVDGVVEQPVSTVTGSGSGAGGDGPTVGEVLNVIQEEQENGNITVDENGNVQVDTEAVAESQSQSRPMGYCNDDGICVSNERAAEALACQLGGAAEKDACMQEVSRGVTRDYISGGEVCQKNSTAEATACREAGRTYNCEFGQCLSEEQVDALAEAGSQCINKATEEEKNSCFADVKETAVRNAASGEYCLKDSAEAKSCEAAGKHWNCNIDFCTDDMQNQAISDAVVECQSKQDARERSICMRELEQNGPYLLASACEEASSDKGVQCTEGGNVWNCEANSCVTPDMNGRLVEAWRKCQDKPNQAETDACMGELQEIADAANEGEAITADDLEAPGSPATVAYVLSAGLAGVAGYMLSKAAGGSGLCYSMAVNVLAAGMGVMNEKNSKKYGDSEIGRLKADFEKFEEKMKKNEGVISYEIQVEAMTFYITSLDTGIRVAENYADGYDQTGNTFGIAAVLAGVEIGIYSYSQQWAKVRCAAAQLASAGISMMISNKAAGIARGIANELKDQKAKLERIRDLFNKHFGNQGGLSMLAYGGNRSGSVTPASTGTVSSATGSQVSGGSKEEGETPSAGCMNANGQFTEKCPPCNSDSNACLNVQPPPFLTETKIGRSVSKAVGVEEALTEANNIAAGRLNHADLNSDDLAARFAKTRKVHKKLFDQLNEKQGNNLKKQNIKLQYPDNKMLASYLNKNVPASQRKGAASKYMSNFLGNVDIEDIKETQKALGKNFTDDGRAVATQTKPITTKFGKFELPKLPQMNELSGEELDILARKKDQEILNSELNGDMEKLKDLPDVHENSTKSLWNILTRRYHTITRQKRIGNWTSK